MSQLDARTVPADPTSTERLAAAGLDYRVVDWSDEAAAAAFVRADTRGFLGPEPTTEQLDAMRETWDARRNIGVYEPDAGGAALPVATLNSWVTPMTVPGGEVPMWAISSVTVSATHRRRGIARSLLEGELRAAAAAGVPIAGLTVSEATIYARYGFAPAIPVAALKISASRAGWTGSAAPGRVEYLEREALAEKLGEVHERSRGQRTGQIPGWESRWLRMAGLGPEHKDGKAVRGVAYRDAEGVVRGVAAYSLSERSEGFRFEMSIAHLAAETDDALRALWVFLLQHDLVEEIRVDLRPVDDPVLWLVADQRAVEVRVHDHGWLRILDVPEALGARTYRAPLDLVLAVTDPLGFAQGRWRLRIDDSGRAAVSATDAAADVTLSAVELAAFYAGGVRATQLSAAGRVQAAPEALASLDDAFRTADAPLLGIWY